jgi:hypothetical protein
MTGPTTGPPADSSERRRDFLACAQAAATLIDHPRVSANWQRETALTQFSVRRSPATSRTR